MFSHFIKFLSTTTSSHQSAYRPLKPNNYFNLFRTKDDSLREQSSSQFDHWLFKSSLGFYIIQNGQESGIFERITIFFSYCYTIVLKCLTYSSFAKFYYVGHFCLHMRYFICVMRCMRFGNLRPRISSFYRQPEYRGIKQLVNVTTRVVERKLNVCSTEVVFSTTDKCRPRKCSL